MIPIRKMKIKPSAFECELRYLLVPFCVILVAYHNGNKYFGFFVQLLYQYHVILSVKYALIFKRLSIKVRVTYEKDVSLLYA